jgi:hypothetical protein
LAADIGGTDGMVISLVGAVLGFAGSIAAALLWDRATRPRAQDRARRLSFDQPLATAIVLPLGGGLVITGADSVPDFSGLRVKT